MIKWFTGLDWLKFLVRSSWVILIVSIVGWPVSQFTVARHEPPFILALSWLAMIYTAANIVITLQVKKDTKDSS